MIILIKDIEVLGFAVRAYLHATKKYLSDSFIIIASFIIELLVIHHRVSL